MPELLIAYDAPGGETFEPTDDIISCSSLKMSAVVGMLNAFTDDT
jgi:hypothetical protein